MCVSVCILVSFIVFYCTSCIVFFSFTYTVYLSVCMSPVYVYGPCCLILNKMMIMNRRCSPGDSLVESVFVCTHAFIHS